MMRKKVSVVLVGLALAGLAACTKNPYGIPPGGPHFASGSHLAYSTRGGEKPQLTKAEFEKAQQEAWWGTAISYNIDELE
jgi:hypothetical protein